MKKITITLLTAGLIFLLPLIGAEEKEEAKKKVDVKLTIGAKAVAKDGEQLKEERQPVAQLAAEIGPDQAAQQAQ